MGGNGTLSQLVTGGPASIHAVLESYRAADGEASAARVVSASTTRDSALGNRVAGLWWRWHAFAQAERNSQSAVTVYVWSR